MLSSTVVPCIIAGGSGTRLWPVSRHAMPKPFIRLQDGQTLLQKTLLRAAGVTHSEALLTVVNRELLFRFLDDYRALEQQGQCELILEPFGRNTAAAVLLCALRVREMQGGPALLLVLPADHLIQDEQAFAEAVGRASELAQQGYLVTFGLQPEYAETGFGYIRTAEALGNAGHRVAEFTEKPDLATAQKFVAGGKHLWNSGMFCMSADTLLAEAAEHAPDLLRQVEASWAQVQRSSGTDHGQIELDADSFAAVGDVSIDVALMERSSRVAVVPCRLGWSDIGSWQAVSQLLPAGENGNRTQGEVMLHDVRNCYIDSPSRLTAAVGVEGLVVIDTPDALLIAREDRSQEVKVIAERLKAAEHPAFLGHLTSVRPWGTYTVLNDSDGYKIKRIVVRPGASLSLQAHHHRSEHWIVVSGTAEVVNGEHTFLLRTNESTFIRVGEKHRLSNPGLIELVLIEVQCGEYLGEDDIVRYEDVYGRNTPGTSS